MKIPTIHNFIIKKLKTLSLIIIFMFCFFNYTALSQNNIKYSKIAFPNPSEIVIKKLAEMGLPLEDGYFNKETNNLEIIVTNYDFKTIELSGLKYFALIDDYGKWTIENLKKGEKEFRKSQTEYIPSGFSFGSYFGYPTLNEYYKMLDTLHFMYPALTTGKSSIGKTWEGRDIYLIKISNYQINTSNKTKVLYTGLHHAREGCSVTIPLYFMFYLLENYNKDSIITYLLNNRELYFIPMVNPDGYTYNTRDLKSFSLWRKNRRLLNITAYGDSIRGIDLNRNYGYKWGYDNTGSSPSKSAENYRGDSAFSENETKAIRNLCLENKFITCINYHTYSNLIVYPWAYQNVETVDSLIFRYYSNKIKRYNNYFTGTCYSAVGYLSNGDSDDWMYGEQTLKSKIFAITIEAGSNDDGFWAPKNRILPIAQENLMANILFAKYAGACIDTLIVEGALPVQFSDTADIKFRIRNSGLLNAQNIIYSISFSDTLLKYSGENLLIPTLAPMNVSDIFNIKLIWDKNAPDKHPTECTINIFYNGFPYSEKFTFNRNKKPSSLICEHNQKTLSYSLKQNYPNPFNPSTNISFSIPIHTQVDLKIFDLLGREIKTFKSQILEPGEYTYNFHATDITSGLYIYQLSAGNYIESRRMLYLK